MRVPGCGNILCEKHERRTRTFKPKLELWQKSSNKLCPSSDTRADTLVLSTRENNAMRIRNEAIKKWTIKQAVSCKRREIARFSW